MRIRSMFKTFNCRNQPGPEWWPATRSREPVAGCVQRETGSCQCKNPSAS